MPKFPDPTKDYTAKPLEQTITPDKLTDQPVYTAPPPSSQDSSLEVETHDKQGDVGTPPPAFPPANEQTPVQPAPVSLTPKSSPPPIPPKSVIKAGPFRNLFPLLIGLAGFVLLAILGFTVLPKLLGGGSSKAAVLTYWGLWEPASVMQGAIADYEREHPNVKINYQMQSPKNYRTRLQSAIDGGTGPDIARIHNTWLPMLAKSLTPAPDGVIDLSEFYPVVAKDLASSDGLRTYAVPLEIDGLALYYNKDILAELSAEPPTDWNTFRKLAFDLTKRNPTTTIVERAGAALGTTNNVDHWSDILGLLILQNSGNPSMPSGAAVQDALTFFTIFSTADKSWDTSQPNSTYAFATGTLAMMLAPAWHAAEIEAINPVLNYGIAPAPKLSGTNIAWATYWAESVTKSSANPEAAWDFLAYLSSDDVLQKLYSAESQIRSFGEPYPKPALANFLSTDPLAAPFVSQANNYQSWYLSARTYDEGINDEFIKYYEDSVNAINDGSGVGATLSTLEAGVAQVAAKYNIQ